MPQAGAVGMPVTAPLGQTKSEDDNVVDADFEEVKDDKKKAG